MRIVTRPDFDGVVCAALLKNIYTTTEPTLWIEPYELQESAHEIKKNDIIANLPYVDGCSLWFDHHYSNKIDKPFDGGFELAPSAARIIFNYYTGRFTKDFTELVEAADDIDSANFTIDQIQHPEKYSYILLDATISGKKKEDRLYWDMVTDLLMSKKIDEIMDNNDVKQKSKSAIEQNRMFGDYLKKHSTMNGHTVITDFRSVDKVPRGNRFHIYSLFPQCYTDMRIRYAAEDREKVIVSLGHNIFYKKSKVNIGELMSQYGGGGHFGAGSCNFHVDKAEEYINTIIKKLDN
ncbi:exopolyphosphatase [Spirochaetota bacterium]